MKPMLTSGKGAFWAGLLGTALLVAAPVAAHADQGKWWTPKESKTRVRSEVQRRVPASDFGLRRGEQRAWRNSPRYGRVYRDYVVIRGAWGGTHPYRAHRYWVRPSYRGHFVYVRPVRYFVTAGVMIGGVRISARIFPRDYWLYGCNFCDAHFGDYGHWAAHVEACRYHPNGYTVRVQDWDDDWHSYIQERGWYPDE